MKRVAAVTVAGDPEQEASFAADLAGDANIDLVLRCVDRTELIAVMRSGGIDVVVLIGVPGWLDPQTTYEVVNCGAALVGLTDDETAGARLHRLGGVALPASARTSDVLAAAANEFEAPLQIAPRPKEGAGRFIAVWGPKGAPGRTSIAIELAATIALADPATILLDADPYGGDVLQLLGVVEELPSLVWATRMAEKGELDPGSLLIELRRAGRRGPVFLPGLPRPELWAEVSDYGWRRVIEIARDTFDFVIADTGFCIEPESAGFAGTTGGRNALARTALAEADHVVAVCKADPVGVRSFLWAFDQLEELVDPTSIMVLLNRGHPTCTRQAGETIDRHLGKRVRAVVADKPADFRRAVAAGETVVRDGAPRYLADPLRELAGAMGADVPASGLLSRLGRRNR